MADVVLGGLGVVVGPVLQNLISLLERRFRMIRDVKKDVEKLLRALSTIQTVLEVAEAQQIKDKQITTWLKMLKNTAYDAEDVLDAWYTKIQQRQLEFTNDGYSSQVSHSIPTCLNLKEVLFRRKMAKKMKEMISTFDDIAEQKNKFHLNTNAEPQTAYVFSQNRETSSIISEPEIYGRDTDQKNIIDILLGHESSILCVLPMIGFGGVGKTTLAKLVYNSERVTKSFDFRIWVCVSEPFDVKRILKEIIESFGASSFESLQSIQTKVGELLKDKKYLLVLDDVWTRNHGEWSILRSSLQGGAKGSSVVVTTRSPRVASITGTVLPYRLGVLSDDDCWSLLEHCALGGDIGEEKRPDLVPIGKEIVKRCKGLPLAAKSLGTLLWSKTEVNHWKHVRDNEIWKLESGEDDILPALRLSYNHLPPSFKQCFAYCSIFPKNFELEKTKLIRLWMANGFIQSQDRMELEEIGDHIFNELLQWSFFQDTKEDSYGNIRTCKMHDLMHDLACSITIDDCRIAEVDNTQDVPKTIRHMSMICHSQSSALHISLPSLRTLLSLDSIGVPGLVFSSTLRVLDMRGMKMETLPPSVCHLRQLRYLDLSWNRLTSLPISISKLINLQMLDLSENVELETLPSSIVKLVHLRCLILWDTGITSIPDSIHQLTNLRWLDLSYNVKLTNLPPSTWNLEKLRYLNLSICSSLESLPESVCDKTNLHSLLLLRCGKLRELPKAMRNMRSLTHLHISGCSELRKLPVGIGELTCLRTLSYFKVGNDPDRDTSVAGINELQGMNQLKGELWIQGLENVRNADDATTANLRSKQFLTLLILEWSDDVDASLQMNNSKKVLEGLLLYLPPKLQVLEINGYRGEEFPKIFQGGNSALLSLKIDSCRKLKSLPAEIGNLTSLTSLSIGNCKELVYFPKELQNLTSLTKLTLKKCPSIKCLPVIGGTEKNSLLAGLVIWQCENLNSVSGGLQYLTSLKRLEIQSCPELELVTEEEGFQCLVSLVLLVLKDLPKLTALPNAMKKLSMLQQLCIDNCKNLRMLSRRRQLYLTSLQKLYIWDCPEMLELTKEDFEHLVSLETLDIRGLPQLITLPEGIQRLPMLRHLKIWRCENLRMLPDWLKHLTTIKSLEISRCHPDLVERCERDMGEDWHKITHIPHLNISQAIKDPSSF